MKVGARFLKPCFAFILLATASYAATTGTIRGTVLDQGGAVLAGAQVTVINEDTNETRNMATDPGGSFQFLLLPVGNYTLQVQRTGFKEYVLRHIPLLVNQVASFTPSLQVGSLETKVTVEANPVQVDTVSTQVGTVISSKPIVDLPLNGRNVYQLIALQPGITVANQANRSPDVCCLAASNSPAPLTFSSGGGRISMNNFMVDGVDANNAFMNQAGVQPIPDAVQEFRVITNTFNAEFGRNSGSIVNVITKSGSNHWHGDLFEFLRNDKLNASNFFESQTGEKATYKLNQFGGTFGGPLKSNKTFVFGSVQISRERRGATGQAKTVFSEAERGGDFSADPDVINNQSNP